jgi:hypothetical protein
MKLLVLKKTKINTIIIFFKLFIETKYFHKVTVKKITPNLTL